MSLLGLDAGTTGCKASVFSTSGMLIASAYREYDVDRSCPGWAELDAVAVWRNIKQMMGEVISQSKSDPVTALAVSSLGEAVVPVNENRQILGPSILNFDSRGEGYLKQFASLFNQADLYRINGNTLGNHYSLTKLKWIQQHQPALYEQTYKFLHWSSFVAFMLGADPVLDYSLANRTLLFDLERTSWSEEMLRLAGLDPGKLPAVAPSGMLVGRVASDIAGELGLGPNVIIATGAHDQCANAVGCGVIEEGHAVYGMGTYLCITPVFRSRREPGEMMKQGLNTEHHAVPGRYVSFIYNQGGALLKWFRDTFAVAEHRRAQVTGGDCYTQLTAEMPAEPSSVVVLPHFAPTGPPEFLSDSCGIMAGLHLHTSRGDILKGILEGSTFYLKQCVEALPSTGIKIEGYRVVGGGSKSNAWVQICADILGRPFLRPAITEAGTLGAAILAGVGSGVFRDCEDGVKAMVKLDRAFEPDPQQQRAYVERFENYQRLHPLMREYLGNLHAKTHQF